MAGEQDPTITVKTSLAEKGSWLAGLLGISRKAVIDIVMVEYIQSNKAVIDARTDYLRNRIPFDAATMSLTGFEQINS